jgi:hypothetical protein
MKMMWTVALLGVLLAVVPGLAQSAGDPSINAILNAPNASAAVSAYAQATRTGSDVLAAQKAFVSKMADFGQPKLAFQQAIDVVTQDPAQGLAWAVAAYNYADRDDPFEAFTDLLVAVRHEPNNPFVIRTAGQLLASFDSVKVNRDLLTSPLRADVGVLKIRYGDNQTFLSAYAEAAATYGGAAVTDQTPPPPPEPAPAASPPSPVYSYPDLSDYGYDYAPPVFADYYYPDLYAGYGLPSCWNPFWGGDCFGAFCGWGSGFGFGHHHGDHGWDHGLAGTGRSGAFGAGRLAAAPGTGFAGGRTAGIRGGGLAAPPGAGFAGVGAAGFRSGGFRSLTTSGGYPSRFSVWHSGSSSRANWSTGSFGNRSASFNRSAGSYRGFSASTGSRSFSGFSRSGGGFRSSGAFRGGGGGGGGFRGGGGGHGGGGHR